MQTQRATLFVDDAQLELSELMGPVDLRERPSRLVLEARTGDGRVSLAGLGNFFRWRRQAGFGLPVNGPGDEAAWSPSFGMRIYLENVGTGALGRMVPLATLIPVSGTMTGQVELDVEDQQVACRTDLTMNSVGYGVNPASPAAAGRVDLLRSRTNGLSVDGRIVIDCDGDLDNRNYRPLYAFQSRVTRQSLADADPALRRAADWDERRLGGRIADQSIDLLAAGLTREARRALTSANPMMGQAFQGAMSESAEGTDGNAVEGGLKSMGRGIKRLFGGGKKKKN